MPIIGGEWFPAVDGHAAQSAVATVAKCFVPLGLVDDLLDRCTDSVQMQFIQNVGDDVGAERLHILHRVAANQLLEVAFFEIPFERVDAGDAQHRRVKQAVDYVEGGNFGVSPPVGQLRQQIWQSKNIADILFELTEFAAGIVDPGWQRGPAQLPAKSFVPFQTAALVLATATTGTWLITVLSQRKRDASSPVATIQARIA